MLLAAADSKAHAELGLTKAGGKYGCRRCGVEGTYIASRKHYYYGDFHRRFYHPAEPKTAKNNRADGRVVDNAPTRKQQSVISLECGVNGESVFYRLYDLYGFDPIQDLVIDTWFEMLSAEIEPLTESSQRGRHSVTYTTLLFPADSGVGAASQGCWLAGPRPRRRFGRWGSGQQPDDRDLVSRV